MSTMEEVLAHENKVRSDEDMMVYARIKKEALERIVANGDIYCEESIEDLKICRAMSRAMNHVGMDVIRRMEDGRK